ncbi:MAG: helix-turn-helix transcriptional regulator [Rhizobiaceae bacterium]|nr:helix-turn-helix transcriptional regulator [Rhizobiaceae bacterium]
MNAREILGWNLRKLRVGKGLSQERLALAAGIDRAYTGRVERGQENVTIDSVQAFANALDVPIADLFVLPSSKSLPPTLPAGRKRKRDH